MTYVKNGGNDHIAGKTKPLFEVTSLSGVLGLPSFVLRLWTGDVVTSPALVGCVTIDMLANGAAIEKGSCRTV